MIVEGRNLNPPASADQIALLRKVLPTETPSDYFDFLARSDGAQVWFNENGPAGFDCIRVFSVFRMLQLRDALVELFPSLLVIGGDQGSQHLGYDLSGRAPWPIVMLLPGAGADKVAASFTELMKRYFLNPGEAVAS